MASLSHPARLLALGLTLGVWCAPVLADSDGLDIGQAMEEVETSDVESVPLPMNGLIFSERNGEVRIISDNGRYIFQGTVYDNWEERQLLDIDDARYSAEHINLPALEIEPEELNPLIYGDGDHWAVAFVVPGQKESMALIDAAPSLRDDVTFHFVVLPDERTPARQTVASVCHANPYEAGEAFVAGRLANVPLLDECTGEQLHNRIITAHFFVLHEMPAVVRGDNKVHIGAHEDWASFLKGAAEQ